MCREKHTMNIFVCVQYSDFASKKKQLSGIKSLCHILIQFSVSCMEVDKYQKNKWGLISCGTRVGSSLVRRLLMWVPVNAWPTCTLWEGSDTHG